MRKTFTSALFIFLIANVFAVEIWVSPHGNDKNKGTKEEPMQTLLMAQRKARELRRIHDPSINNGVAIILKEGKYQLYETLNFRPEDSGTASSPAVVKAAPGEHPVISGGKQVYNWKKVTEDIHGLPKNAKGKIWMANIPGTGGQFVHFRQLWVNGEKATRASTLNDGELPRILSVDKVNESFSIELPGFDPDKIEGLEFVIHQWWAIAILRVKEIKKTGDHAIITFHQPESRIEFEHPWPAPFIDEEKKLNGNSAYYFVNALPLLNKPGEWYADQATGTIYYWPKEGEDPEKDEIIVPVLENIVKVEGSPDLPVSNITFEGIAFEHATWLRPSYQGHVPLQAGWSITDAYKLKTPGTKDKASLENQAWIERQPAGVVVKDANHIAFKNCTFRHMAATGIDFVSGCHYTLVEGCEISDIGGTGLQVGFFGSPRFEAHLPYNPTDEREVCHHNTISNNLVTNCTNEDWGCVGISVGYAYNINIEHNEVSHLNYSGICIGWGWTKTITCMKNNRVYANYIHHFAKNMYDVGGIYTLSAQPNTEISENRIEHLEKAPYAHIPEHYQYIYFDEGSSYIRAINNWTEKDKFFSNTPGPGNEWKNNGPGVDGAIKEKAGLEKAFQYLLIQ